MLDQVPASTELSRLRAITWLSERRAIVLWWSVTRALVLVTALVIHWASAPRGYFGPAIFHRPFGILESWDGRWYRLIAVHGYVFVPGEQSDPAFFQLYPVALKLLSVLGLPVAAGGILLSNLCFLAALIVFDALGRELFGAALARRATLLLAVFPLSYVCSTIYPESLLLLAMCLAGLLAVRGRWFPCAIVGALTGLIRPEGALIAIPLAGIVVARRHALGPEERGRAWASLLTPFAGAFAFPLYLGWSLHNPLAWSEAQRAWGRTFRLDGILLAFTRTVPELAGQVWPYRDFAFCFLFLALLAAAWRIGTPIGWVVMGALLVVLPLTSGSIESDARFGFVSIAAYWGFAAVCRGARTFAATAAVSAVLLVTATATVPLVFP